MASEAKITLSAKDASAPAFASLQKNFETTAALASRLQSGLLAVTVALGVAEVARYSLSVISGAAALDDMSEKTGASVEGLSKLAGVAKISGQDMGSVADAMVKLTKGLSNADEETKGAANALQYLGFKLDDFRKLEPDQQMLAVAKALEKVNVGADRTAIAVDLLGKSGANLLPYLKDLATNGDLVAKVTAEQAAQAEEVEKNLRRWSATIDSAKKALVLDFLPAINIVTDAMVKGQKEGGILLGIYRGLQTFLTGDDRYKNNKDLVDQTVRLFSLEKQLAEFRAAPIQLPNRIKMLEDEIAKTKQALGTTQAYRQVLEQDDAKAIAKPENLKPKERYKSLLPKPVAGIKEQESAYEALNKRIQEALALGSLELESLGKVSEAEKFATKVLVDLANTKKVLSDAEKIQLTGSLTAYLNLSKAIDTKNAKEKADAEKKTREEKTAADAAQEAAKIYEDEAEAINALADANRKAQVDALKSAQDSLKNLQFENSLVLLNNDERTRAIAQRGLEASAIDKTSSAYFDLQAAMNLVLDDSKRLNTIKVFFDEVDGAARNTFEGILSGAQKPFQALETLLRKQLFTALYDLTAKPWIISLQAQAVGTSGSGGLLDQLFGNLFGGSSSSKALDALGNGSWANGLSFAGGGYTGDGSRSGGLDGQGGFLAMMHPQEEVIDHTLPEVARRSANAGAGGNLTVIDQSTRAAPVRYTEQTMPGGERALIIRDAVAAVNSNMHDPNSSTSRAMAQNYRGLARAR